MTRAQIWTVHRHARYDVEIDTTERTPVQAGDEFARHMQRLGRWVLARNVVGMSMRKLIVSEFVTLDGVMEAPGGEPSHPHTGWVVDFSGPEQEQYKFQEVLDAETLLIGRVTYESFAGAWPGYEGPFADRMNSMSKVVVSSTLSDPAWSNTTVLTGDVVSGVTDLKHREGGPIVVAGSKTLVHALLDHDLVDELRVMVFPVTIGAGLRLFPDTVRKTTWSLVDSLTFPSTVRVDTFHRA